MLSTLVGCEPNPQLHSGRFSAPPLGPSGEPTPVRRFGHSSMSLLATLVGINCCAVHVENIEIFHNVPPHQRTIGGGEPLSGTWGANADKSEVALLRLLGCTAAVVTLGAHLHAYTSYLDLWK